jgi:hypothetical protein
MEPQELGCLLLPVLALDMWILFDTSALMSLMIPYTLFIAVFSIIYRLGPLTAIYIRLIQYPMKMLDFSTALPISVDPPLLLLYA